MVWLKNRWYQAAWSDEIGVGKPLVRTICDEPVLLYRGDDDGVRALFDRCPHRFAPLSEGRFEGGRVVCGYHGLAFDGSGACVANPHSPITSRMRVRAYPVVERHAAIWLWMGEAEHADPPLIPDMSFIDAVDPAHFISAYMWTEANYQLLTDNIMDLSHTDYLHPTTLGGMITGAKASTSEAEGDSIVAEWMATDCIAPPAFAHRIPGGGTRADIRIHVDWLPPAWMLITADVWPANHDPGGPCSTTLTLHNMTPANREQTHYFMCSVRPDEDAEKIALLRSSLMFAFTQEDKPMLEKVQKRMGTPDLWALKPLLLPIDAAAVRVRRKLDALIAAENRK